MYAATVEFRESIVAGMICMDWRAVQSLAPPPPQAQPSARSKPGQREPREQTKRHCEAKRGRERGAERGLRGTHRWRRRSRVAGIRIAASLNAHSGSSSSATQAMTTSDDIDVHIEMRHSDVHGPRSSSRAIHFVRCLAAAAMLLVVTVLTGSALCERARPCTNYLGL